MLEGIFDPKYWDGHTIDDRCPAYGISAQTYLQEIITAETYSKQIAQLNELLGEYDPRDNPVSRQGFVDYNELPYGSLVYIIAEGFFVKHGERPMATAFYDFGIITDVKRFHEPSIKGILRIPTYILNQPQEEIKVKVMYGPIQVGGVSHTKLFSMNEGKDVQTFYKITGFYT